MELLLAIFLAYLIATALFPRQFIKPISRTQEKGRTAKPIPGISDGIYPVLKIADGDTITIADKTENSGKRKIRLNGIDAPEHSMRGKPEQPYAKESQALLTRLCKDGVRIQITSTDKWGRFLAWIYTLDGLCINAEMVRQGAAWYYEQFCRNNKTLAAYQAEAQRQRIGLWGASKNPEAPWDYRNK